MAQYDGSIRINTEINSKNASAQLSTLENRIVKTADKVSTLRSKMDSLKNAKIPTQEYKEISDQIAKAETEFNKLLEKQEQMQREGKDHGAAWDRLNEKMDEVGNTIKYAQGELQDLVDTEQAFNLGSDTQEYSNLEKQLGYLEGDYATLIQRRNEFMQKHNIHAGGYERLQADIQELYNSFSKIAHPIEAIKSSFSSAMESIKEKAAGVSASIINGIAHPLQTMKKIASSAISGTTKLLSGMTSVAKKAGKVISSIASVLKKATSAMFGFGKSTKSSNNMLQAGFKNFLKYGLGIRSFYALINKFRTAIKEGFGNLAQYSEPVNAALSSLKSSLLQLKNSLATAFAPILTAIAPALTFFIDMVSRAVTAVGMLIAALTGQGAFVKATKAQQNYAKSLGGTAKAAKDANKQLSSLDKLNNLTSNDSGGSGGGGGGGAGVGDMFETVDIPSRISDLAEMIKDAWAKADFTEVGALIGEKLKDALDNIPWDKIQATAAKVGKSLATLINGFVSAEGLPETIGKTIGEAINTGIIGINAFLDNTKWEEVGKFLGKGANSVVNTIDWEGIGHLFAAKFNAVFKTLESFAEEFDWANFGVKVGTGLTKAISDFDWMTAGASVGKTVSGLFQTLKSFIDNTDWRSLGTGIITAISSFFSNIDWGTVSGAISSFVIGLLDFLIGLVEGVDWSGVPQKVIDAMSDFFSGFDYEGVFGKIGELIGTAVAAGIDLLKALGDVLANAWDSVVEYFKGYIEASGGNIVEGLWNGIIDALKSVGDWIKKNIFDPFIKGFKSAFGIHSPSTVMAEMGKFIIEGLKKGISDIWGSFMSFWSNKKSEIITKFNDIKQKFTEKGRNVIAGLRSGISEKWSAFSSWWTEKRDSIVNKFQTIRDKFMVKGRNIVSGVKSGIVEKWSEFSSWWTEKRDSIVGKFDGIREKMSNVGKNIVNGIIDGIKSIWETLAGWARKIMEMFTIKVNASDGGGTTASSGASAASYNAASPPAYSPATAALASAPIPKLATGAVIPSNREFLAVLGDQKNGRNLEAPEGLIRKIVREESGGTGVKEITIKVPVEIDGKVLFELVKKLDAEQWNRTGRPSFQM